MTKTKIQTIAGFAILTALIFFYSCRKVEPDAVPLSLEKNFSAEVAKEYFTQNLKKNLVGSLKTTARILSEEKTFLGKYNIKWRLAKSFRRGKYEMVEAPMRFERNRLVMYSFGGNEGKEDLTGAMARASFNKFLLYRTEEGRVITRILTFIPDKNYIEKYGMEATKNGSDHLEKNFSGYVEFRTWKQESLFVYRIKNGKVVKKVKLRRNQAASQPGDKNGEMAQTLSNCNIVCDPIYGLVCREGDFNSESSSGYDMECSEEVVDYDCYEDPFCNPYDPGDDPWDDPCDLPGSYYLPECGYDPDPCLDYGICVDDPDPTNPGDPLLQACLDDATSSYIQDIEDLNDTWNAKVMQCYATGYSMPLANLLQVFPGLFEAILEVRATFGGSLAQVDYEALIGYVEDLEAANQFITTCVVSSDSEFDDAAYYRQALLHQRWNWCYANN